MIINSGVAVEIVGEDLVRTMATEDVLEKGVLGPGNGIDVQGQILMNENAKNEKKKKRKTKKKSKK